MLALILLVVPFITAAFWLWLDSSRTETTNAAVGINQQITYQGRLATSAGISVTSGNYNFKFELYNDASAGTLLWEEAWTSTTTAGVVSIVNGVFSVNLGTSTSLSTVDFNSNSLFLKVQFDANSDGGFEETFSPRKRITSSPYAFNADQVDGLHATTTATAGQLLALDANKGLSITQATTTGNMVIGVSSLGAPTSSLSIFGGLHVFSGVATTSNTLWVGSNGIVNNLDLTGGDLYVADDLEVDGTAYFATSTFTQTPSLPHSFSSWATGAANSNVSNASVYINPSSAVGDSNLLGLAVNGSVIFLVDAEGDIFGNNLTLAGTQSVGLSTISTLTVENNSYLGDMANSDWTHIKGTAWINANKNLSVVSSTALVISQEGTGNYLEVQDNSTYYGGTRYFTIANDGTASTTKLYVQGSATTTSRLVLGTTNPTNNYGSLWSGVGTGGGAAYFNGGVTTTDSFYSLGLASTTLGLFTQGNLWVGDNATTSRMYLGTTVGLNSVYINNWTDLIAITGGQNWVATSWGTDLTPTSTSAGIFVKASSTIESNFRVQGNATTTLNLTVLGTSAFGPSVQPSATSTLRVLTTNTLADGISGTSTSLFVSSPLLTRATGGYGPNSLYRGIYVQSPTGVASTTYGIYNEGDEYIGGNVTTTGYLVLGTTNPSINLAAGSLWAIYATSSQATSTYGYFADHLKVGTTTEAETRKLTVGGKSYFGSDVYIQGGVTTTNSLLLGDYASSTGGLFTQGKLWIGGGATTTNLAVSGLNITDCDLKANTNGTFYCGTDATGGGGGSAWQTLAGTGTALIPTSTNGIVVNAASSTITQLTVNYATTSNRLVLGTTQPTNNYASLWAGAGTGGGAAYFNGGVTTTDSFYALGLASSTLGLFTQGNGHYGGTLSVDKIATTSSYLNVGISNAQFALSAGDLFVSNDAWIGGSDIRTGAANWGNNKWLEYGLDSGLLNYARIWTGDGTNDYLEIREATYALWLNDATNGKIFAIDVSGNASTTGTLVLSASANSAIWNSPTNTLSVVGSGLFTKGLRVGDNATTSGYLVVGTTNPTNNMAVGDALLGGDLRVIGTDINIGNEGGTGFNTNISIGGSGNNSLGINAGSGGTVSISDGKNSVGPIANNGGNGGTISMANGGTGEASGGLGGTGGTINMLQGAAGDAGQYGNDGTLNIGNSTGLKNAKLVLNGSATTTGSFYVGGQLGIGTATPSSTLSVAGNVNIWNRLAVATGYHATTKYAITLPNNINTGYGIAYTWENYSDTRIKTEQRALDYGLEEILKLTPKRYIQHSSDFVNGELVLGDGAENIGLIAQEVYGIIPEAVSKPDDESTGLWGMSYNTFIPVIIKSIQELSAKVDQLVALSQSIKDKETAQLIVQKIELPKIDYSIYNTKKTFQAELVQAVNDLAVGRDSYFNGKITVAGDSYLGGNLIVGQAASFYGSITVKGEANFEVKVSFLSDIEVKGKVYVNRDQAGSVIIPTFATSTEVIFATEYLGTPRVVATPQDNLESKNYWISDKTTKGFRINMSPTMNKDIKFDWLALAVKDDFEAGAILAPQVAGASEVAGCTDLAAVNYNNQATQNDGFCVYLTVAPAPGSTPTTESTTTPESTPTSEPAPTPEPAPAPELTSNPEPEPESELTPEPTLTPESASTPEPTSAPASTPIPEPAPASTPEPTPTLEPAPI